jgi:hypothetical protein
VTVAPAGDNLCWLQALRLVRELLSRLGHVAPAIIRASGQQLWEVLSKAVCNTAVGVRWGQAATMCTALHCLLKARSQCV